MRKRKYTLEKVIAREAGTFCRGSLYRTQTDICFHIICMTCIAGSIPAVHNYYLQPRGNKLGQVWGARKTAYRFSTVNSAMDFWDGIKPVLAIKAKLHTEKQ